MVDVKISALTAAGSALGTDEYVVNQGGVTVKLTAAQFATYLRANLGAATGTSLALGGATLGSNALAVTGTANISSSLTANNLVATTSILLGAANTITFNGRAQVGAISGDGNIAALANNNGPATFWSSPVTAIPAGGNVLVGLRATSATNFGVFFGSGAPSLTAAKGSLYLRSDGTGTNDRMYVATDSAGAWTAVVTVA